MKTRMRRNALASLGIALALAGCGKAPPAPAAAAPVAAASAPAPQVAVERGPDLSKYAELMQAVFAGGYDRSHGLAEAVLPEPDDRTKSGKFLLTPVDMAMLPDGGAVLVLNGEALDEGGATLSSHSTPGLLSVYVLRREEGRWKVVRRHENIDSLGSNGSIGHTKWTTLADGKPGLAVEHGGTWQGHTITLLSLYDVSADSLHDLADALKIHSDNSGWCGPTTDKCWDISGQWQFVRSNAGAPYDDLRLDFSGKEQVAAPGATDRETDVEPVRKTVQVTGSARYVYKDDGYKLANGENPVPGI